MEQCTKCVGANIRQSQTRCLAGFGCHRRQTIRGCLLRGSMANSPVVRLIHAALQEVDSLEQELARGVAAADAARKRKRSGSSGMAVAPKAEDGSEEWKEGKEGLLDGEQAAF